MGHCYIIQVDGCKSYKVGITDRMLTILNGYGKHKLLTIQAVSKPKEVEEELLTTLRDKFESSDEVSFFGNYLDILQCFLSITSKYPIEENIIPQHYTDETDDPSHLYPYEYYIRRQYIEHATLPQTLPSDIVLSKLSCADMRKLCLKYYPNMGITLTLKKSDLKNIITKCNDYILNFNGINRDHIPSNTKGDVQILNLKNLCKNDRVELRRKLMLKKTISLEMVYYEALFNYNNLKNLDLIRSSREHIMFYLSKFAECNSKINTEELILLVKKTIRNIEKYIKN